MDRKNQAYEYLKNAIINNEIPQGTPLREVEISATLNMSRTPIREALRELEMEGVIVSYPSRGAFVSTITPYDVEEIYALRTLLEVWALEQGFNRISDDDLDHFENIFKSLKEPFDWEAYHDTDRRFHQMLIDRSGSRRLNTFVSTLNTQVEMLRRYSAKSSTRSSRVRTAEHLHIIECIRKRNLASSKKALRDHLHNVSSSAIESCKSMYCNN